MGQAIGVATRADPTAIERVLTEGYLTQPMIMARGIWGLGRGVLTANFEDLTLKRGELTTGAYGEGYVDRRHPHAYFHELLAGLEGETRGLAGSLFAGRGFVPFGSDDPMVRPFEKYPVNHHLAQVLERLVAIVAVRRGPVIAEVGTFNGDEPLSATSAPAWDRFGDSWSTRLTLLPARGFELSASYADVESPEIVHGDGLDQRKKSVVARYNRATANARTYALAEWAHTDEHYRGTVVAPLSSVLAEGAYCRGGAYAGLRFERTDRPEEETTLDPFRTPRPANHVSSLGVSRWTTVTFSLSPLVVSSGVFSGRPFIEVARIHAAPGNPAGLFNADFRYGKSRMWMFSAGLQLRAGAMHDRMGRYGVADPADTSYRRGNSLHSPASHQMTPSHAASSTRHVMFHKPVNRCSV